MTPEQQERLRELPSIAALLDGARKQAWSSRYSSSRLASALRLAVGRARDDLRAGRSDSPWTADMLIERARDSLEASGRLNLRPVINATGIVLHTGLGRAPLCDAAVDALIQVAGGYANVELDLQSGRRGQRAHLVRDLLTELTGAEAATVVNNNAAATLLVLNELAEGKKAIVSRGELIEIGGSFRMPDIMKKSGAIMCEVGTTNRTRLADYEQAIDPNAGVLVLVHTSNYRVTGFTESVSLAQLVDLGRRHAVPVYHDLGSGALADLSRYGLAGEPWAGESVRAGADVVTFSADKLLGGPQCGIIVGSADTIARIEANPFHRAFRVDKLTLAALEATLRCHLDAEQSAVTVPAMRMLTADREQVARRAKTLRDKLSRALPAERFETADQITYAGGGSLPTVQIPTTAVVWRPRSLSPDQAAASLRRAETPIVVRVSDDRVVFDLRTLRDEEFSVLCECLTRILSDGTSPSAGSL